ncbi:hypothetical protein ENBRE01_2402 [Enteropsectra breve]|nr:hypothetical protein ENBRE01_2402 [Enteropsectra breve]
MVESKRVRFTMNTAERVWHRLDLDYLGGPIAPTHLSALRLPIKIDMTEAPSGGYIGSKTTRLKPQHTAEDTRPAPEETEGVLVSSLPTLYLGWMNASIGKVYVHAVLPSGAEREPAAKALFDSIDCLIDRVSSSALGYFDKGEVKTLWLQPEDMQVFSEWVSGVLGSNAPITYCIESYGNKNRALEQGGQSGTIEALVHQVLDPVQVPELSVDLAGNYWPCNRNVFAVAGPALFDALGLSPNFNNFFSSTMSDYNSCSRHNVCGLQAEKVNIYSGLEDIIPAEYKSGAGAPYTTAALMLNAYGCRLGGNKTSAEHASKVLEKVRKAFSNPSSATSAFRVEFRVKFTDSLYAADLLSELHSPDNFLYADKAAVFSVLDASMQEFCSAIELGVAPTLPEIALAAYLELVMSFVFLRGCHSSFKSGLPALNARAPKLTKALRLPNFKDLTKPLHHRTAEQILVYLVREQKYFDAATRKQVIEVIRSYYGTMDVAELKEPERWVTRTSEHNNGEAQAAVSMQRFLQKLLLPRILPKKSTTKQFAFAALTERFGLDTNALLNELEEAMVASGALTAELDGQKVHLGESTKLADSCDHVLKKTCTVLKAEGLFCKTNCAPRLSESCLLRLIYGLWHFNCPRAVSMVSHSSLLLFAGVFSNRVLHDRLKHVRRTFSGFSGAKFFARFLSFDHSSITEKEVSNYYDALGCTNEQRQLMDKQRSMEADAWGAESRREPKDLAELFSCVLQPGAYNDLVRAETEPDHAVVSTPVSVDVSAPLSAASDAVLACLARFYQAATPFTSGRARNRCRIDGKRLSPEEWNSVLQELVSNGKLTMTKAKYSVAVQQLN